jgi:hypothetical protein
MRLPRVCSLAPLAVAFVLYGAACGVPPVSERVTDAARDLNVAARFGRMDVAVNHTAGAARENFLSRRAAWGQSVRIHDVELAGMEMPDGTHAKIQVDYSWARVSEGVLRTTRIAQDWEDTGKGWKLVREKRVQGDLGLFGEPVPETSSEPHPDVQFATKVIQ